MYVITVCNISVIFLRHSVESEGEKSHSFSQSAESHLTVLVPQAISRRTYATRLTSMMSITLSICPPVIVIEVGVLAICMQKLT